MTLSRVGSPLFLVREASEDKSNPLHSGVQRRERNQDLLRRMKRGESLSLFSPEQTFFPPRPIIKKDKDEMRRLYNRDFE